MPHQTCSVCSHRNLQAINLALRTSSCSLRVLAGQFGVSKTALDRHRHHLDGKKDRQNTEQIAQIDDQIRRLKRAQTAARRRRDSAAFVRLSGELRQWHMLKAKIQGATLPEKGAPAAPVSERDALQMAMAIVEMNLTGDQRHAVTEWLTGLMERLPPDAVPTEQSGVAYGSEQLPENSDSAVTVGIAACKPLHT